MFSSVSQPVARCSEHFHVAVRGSVSFGRVLDASLGTVGHGEHSTQKDQLRRERKAREITGMRPHPPSHHNALRLS